MNRFKKDPNYLLRYSIVHCALFSVLCIVLSATKGFNLYFEINKFDYLISFAALLLCGLPSSILHNCAHRNVGPRFLNDLIGEFLGTVMLYGYRGFSLGHMFHHKYPDNPEFDPHPPQGQSFLRFVVSPIKATLVIIERAYFKEYGENSKTRANITMQKIFFNSSIFLKLLFWFLLFGAKNFFLFYLVLYVSNIFVFAHINYATHVEDEHGQSQIINLNNNLYYKIVNVISFGGYFHKNHHLRPRVFNPSRIVGSAAVLNTYKSETPSLNKKTFDLLFIRKFLNTSKWINHE